MARIPGTEIERLKQEISLQRLAESQGIELKRHGADLCDPCTLASNYAMACSKPLRPTYAIAAVDVAHRIVYDEIYDFANNAGLAVPKLREISTVAFS